MKQFTQNLLFLSLTLLFVVPESANALPGFARQTGQSCMACHTQNMPKLNNTGRNFALSGYTLYDATNEKQALIEGSDVVLGLPSTLNVSAVLKARYVKSSRNLDLNSTDIVGIQRGELQVLQGSGLYFGGRFADNVGGIISLTGDSAEENDVVFGGKGVLSYPALNGYAGFSLYSTQINGVFSGMENYNTGLNAPLRQFENANGTNAAQATGIGRGPGTGLQLYYGDSRFFITAGATVPSQNNEGIDAGGSLLPFGRIAYNQPIGEWNIMLGAFGLSGDVKASDQSLNGGLIDNGANLVEIHREGYGFDLEASGSIAGMMTMTTVNLVVKNTVSSTPTGLLTNPNLQRTDNEAGSFEFQINPISPLGVKAAYLNYKNNDNTISTHQFVEAYDFEAYSFGLNYLLRQNIILDIEYSYNNPQPDTSIDDFYDLYVSATLAF